MTDFGWMGEWVASDVFVQDVALLFAAVERRRDELGANYASVAVRRPSAARKRPLLTVGALVTLWDRWSAMTGVCPACGARVLGTGFNGLLSRADAFGVCTGCARALRRPIQGGIGVTLGNANRALNDSQYRCGPPWGGDEAEPHADLVAALQKLGEPGLPRTVGAVRPFA